ncbi:LytTR family transcriptional regulator DNA-binding domain-containing protein [Sphingobacterium yanglingense]|uniref:LytTR family transcriptional regulator DNA-binding domain-containing protein n=1 Tax=Sphingobacterium yanglingense TaxID=1437280 RepID=UPI0013C2CF92|nr:LytTR family transcriptional regulator DNA-binding domain-containing protein [Sphingobacterium yanglingense]
MSIAAQEIMSRYLTIKSNGQKTLVHYDELFYIKSGKDESTLYFVDENSLTVKEGIGIFEEDLPNSDFKRVHNQYIINKSYAC